MNKKHNYCITAADSTEGCKKLLKEGGEKRIAMLTKAYSYLSLEIKHYFWLDAGRRVVAIVECEDRYAEDALSALKMHLFTSGLYEYIHMERMFNSEDIDALKNLAHVIE